FVERHGLSTLQMRDALARHFNVKRHAIGHAGLKDKHALTRQVFSIHTPGKKPEDFPSFDHTNARILWVDLHKNKLKRGHLAGNRFAIRVRGVNPTAVLHAKKSLDLLSAQGLPNRFGPQRFGYLQNNHLVGRAMILGDAQAALDLLLLPHKGSPKGQIKARTAYSEGRFGDAAEKMHKVFKVEYRALCKLADGAPPEEAIRAIDPTAAGFYISSFQSAIFNRVLNERVLDGLVGKLVLGDLAFLMKSRRSFPVTEAELGDPELADRLSRFEITPSGPMWGTSMLVADGEVGNRERLALAQAGVTTKDMESCEARDGFTMIGGDRRPIRIPVIDPDVESGADEHGAYIRCAFDLPRGSFATTVMDEIMKVSGNEEHADGA
ncbi:MAG: tRNA pseudouridine(13) synthase TruD, partial [Phycisphaerales bacterium]|nr:tRNA pseudouridine(13) synthase TruD [Phycisphaerales bacterium]